MAGTGKAKHTGDFHVRDMDLDLKARAIAKAREERTNLTVVVIKLVELWVNGKVKL